MTIWSDDEGKYIDVEIVWSGSMKTPIPGVGGIERRSAYLTAGAPCSKRNDNTLLSKQEMVGKTELTGLQVGSTVPLRPCSTGCGRRVSAAGMRQGYLRCNQCRHEGRGGRWRKRKAA